MSAASALTNSISALGKGFGSIKAHQQIRAEKVRLAAPCADLGENGGGAAGVD